jgi:squalene-associated FAD-dependent desaturase
VVRVTAEPTRHADVVVVGGGLAGLAAALECSDGGARVTLLERRKKLGGLTWSFEHGGFTVDNGQHVFLRCCTEYISFLERIGASGDVTIEDRLDVPVVAPGSTEDAHPKIGRLRRNGLPAPLHLAGALSRFPHLSARDKLGLGRALIALRRLRLEDPALDTRSFADWLIANGQSETAITSLWDLITVPTVNLPAAEASLAMGAKVFKTGLLSDRSAADIGWSRVPLGRLHGEHASRALAVSGVEVRTAVRVLAVEPSSDGQHFSVVTEEGAIEAGGVVVAVPHEEAGDVLPRGAVPAQDRLNELGHSSVVDVHLLYDRRVSEFAIMAGHDSPVQWVFDRTESSAVNAGGGSRQYLAVSLSAADQLLGRRPEDLVSWISVELGRLLPAARHAEIVDSLVTKERRATFRARPGTAALRPSQRTAIAGLAVAGAWTDTGWPATMEGAVRSGRTAAHECLRAIRARGFDPKPMPPRTPSADENRTTQEVA